MAQDPKIVAALALNRFGMGPRPGSIAAIEADPRGALLAELDRPRVTEVAAAELPSSAQAFRTVADANAERQARQIMATRAQKEAERQRIAAAPTMAEGKFEFGFAVDWMRKDLGICLDEAARNGARLPVTALVDQFYAQVQARGGKRWDTSSLVHLLQNP